MTEVVSLQTIPLFSRLTDRQIARAEELFRSRSVPEGHVLMVEGRPSEEVAVILDGHVRIERRGQLVTVAGPGEIVGDVGVRSGCFRQATATALSPVRLLVADGPRFRTFSEHPAVRAYLLEGDPGSTGLEGLRYGFGSTKRS